jgi:outer membrane autotransporter protein
MNKQFYINKFIRHGRNLIIGIFIILLYPVTSFAEISSGIITLNGIDASINFCTNSYISATILGLSADPLGNTSGIIIRHTSGTLPSGITTVNISGIVGNYSVVGGAKIGTYGTSSGNIINFNSGSIGNAANEGTIVGGLTFVADTAANENKVTIQGTVNKNVIGGQAVAASSTVKDNEVFIKSGASIESDAVYGGFISVIDGSGNFVESNGTIESNDVTVEAGDLKTVFGGYYHLGDTDSVVKDNNVYIKGGHIIVTDSGTGTASGGGGIGEVDLINNHIFISNNAKVDSTVYGAHLTMLDPADDDAINATNILKGNKVTMTAGTVGGVVGARELKHNNITLEENIVTITGGNITGNGDVHGAFASTSHNNTLINNEVHISNINTEGYITGAAAWNDSSTGNNTLKGNKVYANNMSTLKDIIGGTTILTGNSITENEVHINNVTVRSLFGGLVSVTNNTVKDNLIVIEGGTNIINSNAISYGSIEIKDGINTFKGIVSTRQAGKNIDITGGNSEFRGTLLVVASDETTASGNVNVTNATLRFTSAASVTHKATTFNFNSNSLLELGTNSANTFDGNATFANGAVLNLGTNYDSNFDGNVTFASGSTLKTTYGGTTQYGKLTTTSGGVVSGASNVNVVLSVGEGFSADDWIGKEIIIGDAASDFTYFSSQFYGFEIPVAGTLRVKERYTTQDIIENALGFSVSGKVNYVNAGNFLEAVLSGGNTDMAGDFMAALSEIGALPASLKEVAFKQLIGEPVVNIPQAAAATAFRAQGVVNNRLDRLREIELDNLTPPAAGGGEALNRVWAGGFGVWADAKSKNGVFGFDYEGGGVALGYDRRFEGVPGLRLGVSTAFSNGTMDNKDGLTEVDVDTYSIGLYGSYNLPGGLFFDGNVAYGRAKNEYATRQLVGAPVVSGEFDVDSWQFGARVGYVVKTGSWQFIPSVGLRYLKLKQDSWAERPTDVARRWFAEKTDSELDVPLQVKISTTFEAGSAVITPEFRLGYAIVADKPDNLMNVGHINHNNVYEPGTYPVLGIRSRRNTFQAGAGVKVNTGGALDFFVNYDLDAASGYKSHNASIGLGFEF